LRTVFADTLLWIARVRPRDPWQTAARTALQRIGDVRLVTTDEVLNELLAALSRGGPVLRRKAVETVRLLLGTPAVTVVPQTRQSFLAAVNRYEARSDKTYSLTDCASMNAMDAQGIREILTSDRHFEQEGFLVLIEKR